MCVRNKFFLSLMVVIIAFAVPVSASHWGYEGHSGPAHWGDLSPEFTACKDGKSQSPVDISGAQGAALPVIAFDYKPSPLRIVNNGHAIMVSYARGSSITVDGNTFQLLQYHFHTPSENMVDGKHFPMEAHFVHKDKDGKLAVIGLFLTEGEKNEILQRVWDHMPKEEGKEMAFDDTIVNAMDLLPKDMAYYRFDGSLTTPPCSEGVSWLVLKTPVKMSADQIKAFSDIYPMNARPVQPLNGRHVKVSK